VSDAVMAIPIYGDPQMFGWRERLSILFLYREATALADKRRKCRASRYLPRGSI